LDPSKTCVRHKFQRQLCDARAAHLVDDPINRCFGAAVIVAKFVDRHSTTIGTEDIRLLQIGERPGTGGENRDGGIRTVVLS